MIDEYKKVIVDYCKTHPGTSFAELNDAFNDADLDYRGAESIVLADYENVVIWSNWCSDAVQAFQELLNDEITTFSIVMSIAMTLLFKPWFSAPYSVAISVTVFIMSLSFLYDVWFICLNVSFSLRWCKVAMGNHRIMNFRVHMFYQFKTVFLFDVRIFYRINITEKLADWSGKYLT